MSPYDSKLVHLNHISSLSFPSAILRDLCASAVKIISTEHPNTLLRLAAEQHFDFLGVEDCPTAGFEIA